ncbi:chemotaxis protein CheW [Alienimonas chondri]|uniref:CheW-like domain-containing protein n=1 Tax=Alienimonas chondri TaxID=2681879 RepID=A0ABX1VAQ0_9PLAN|nr:chemotaxis protein CheW [Alienimonas chondri]NNJ25001.1 hypothetical protein [Alienimonas chondri]
MNVQLLQFRVGDHRFALRIEAVREVLRAVALTEPIDRSRRIEGLLNLRGRTLPVVDLRGAVGLPEKPMALTDALVVIDHQDASWALRVDGGLTTIEAAADAVQSCRHSPVMSESVQADGRVTFLLDLNKLRALVESSDPLRRDHAGAGHAEPAAAGVVE